MGERELELLLVLELPDEIVAIALDHSDAPHSGPWMVSRPSDRAAWEGGTIGDESLYSGILLDDLFVLGGMLPPGCADVQLVEPDGTQHSPSLSRGAWLIALAVSTFPSWSNRRWRPGVELRRLDAEGAVLAEDEPPHEIYRPEPW